MWLQCACNRQRLPYKRPLQGTQQQLCRGRVRKMREYGVCVQRSNRVQKLGHQPPPPSRAVILHVASCPSAHVPPRPGAPAAALLSLPTLFPSRLFLAPPNAQSRRRASSFSKGGQTVRSRAHLSPRARALLTLRPPTHAFFPSNRTRPPPSGFLEELHRACALREEVRHLPSGGHR